MRIKRGMVVPGIEVQALPGERTNKQGKPVANNILLALPDSEFDALRNELEYLELPQYTVLHQPRQRLDALYFLNSGMVSLVFRTKDNETVEVGVVGNEGFTPIPVAGGLRSSPHQAIMQVGGDGFKMRIMDCYFAGRGDLNVSSTVTGAENAKFTADGCNIYIRPKSK